MINALYRRYRPESFEEVIGQEHVTAPLMAALAAGNTTHAYLFSGPRGCGKTTSARILARCLNCAEYPTATPCGKCESCRELARDGSGSFDVVELDAASHGGVDDARELRDQASFAPLRDRFKIFIIDEAHMVSNQGFNALLKLVEEPPAHVKFIFATTEPEKVIGTIRSRTHHYPFRLVPPDVLENYLGQLCEAEGVQAGKDVLSLVVRAGTGSVRDTLSVLDQIIGGSDGKMLEYERAVALLGYTSAHLLDQAVVAISASDGAALFGVVDAVVKSGHDPRRFVEDLLQRLRDLVIIALAGESVKDVFLSVPDDQYALMVAQASELGARRASQAADLVNDALTNMVGATAPRLQLELLCARLIVTSGAGGAMSGREAAGAGSAGVPQAGSVETAKAQIPAQQAPARAMPPQSRMPDPRTQPMPSFMPESADDPASQGGSEPAVARSNVPEHSASELPAPMAEAAPERHLEQPAQRSGPSDPLDRLRSAWSEIVNAASEESRIAGNILKHATGDLRFEGGVLSVGFENAGTAAGFQHNRKAQAALAHAIESMAGMQLQIAGHESGIALDARPKAEAEIPAPAVDLAPAAAQPAEVAELVEPELPEAPADPALPAAGEFPPEALAEDEPAETDPVYELQPESGDEPDPAGVLAQLLDLAEPVGASEPSAAYPDSQMAAPAAAKVLSDPGPDMAVASSAFDSEPFFAQDLPQPPPSELPEPLRGEIPDFPQAPADPPAWLQQREVPAAASRIMAPFGMQEHTQTPLDQPQPGSDFSPEPSSEPVFENEWDEVSPDDPEISASTLVGINVVMEVLGGTIEEEIPHA